MTVKIEDEPIPEGKKKVKAPKKKKPATKQAPVKADMLKGITHEISKVDNPIHRVTDGHKYNLQIMVDGKIHKFALDHRPTALEILNLHKSTQPKKK